MIQILSLDNLFSLDDVFLATYGVFVIAALAAIILIRMPKSSGAKLFFFWTIASIALFVAFFIASNTIYENITLSPTGGPVHWHADFRIFHCGEEKDIFDPHGLSNRVGTSLIHEHGDNRIHVEGTILRREDASLRNFFEKIGGLLTTDAMRFETNNGVTVFKNGDLCPDGKSGILQVFLWKTENGILRQSKLENFPAYIISPHALIPPGDCIIFEFSSQEKPLTENICEHYALARSRGDIKRAK